MSGADSKAPIDQRASMRTSMRLSLAPGEDDDYDLQALGISDGFRPQDVAQSHVVDPTIDSQTPPPMSQAYRPPRPSSITKPPQPRESFTLRHDGGMGPLSDASPAESSASSSRPSTIVRSESPYQGPSGPSFPYQMYAQDVRPTRTASVTTASTVPMSEPSYQGPSNPTHPYQMYPQNTIPPAENASDDATAPASAPVGFTNAPDNYQRRIGPEGEEAGDMIGPDGHTEQLPPYTRYPDEAYQRKIAGIGGLSSESPVIASSSASSAPPPAAATAVSAPLRAVPGAGGIGLATRNPEFASSEDLSLRAGATSPQSRQSLRSFRSDGSHHEINTAAQAVVNEKKPLKNWQIAAKRKVWGVVPCWALALTVIILVMLGIVLGVVLGFFLNKPRKPQNGNPSPMGYDAFPLATVPPGLAPLPEGSYALPLMVSRAPATCFNDSTQAQAWNCNPVFAQQSVNIKQAPNRPDTSRYLISIDYNQSFTIESNQYPYGTQPPRVKDVQLLLVNDVNEPSRGPAWAFEAEYNKTVIIPEALFPRYSSSGSKSKRLPLPGGDPSGFPRGDFKRKGLAQDGDKPWMCFWGGTILEVFVYPSQNNSRPDMGDPQSIYAASTNPSIVTPAYATSVPTAGPARVDGRSGGRGDYDGITTSSAPTGTASATSTATLSSTGFFETARPMPSDFKVPLFPRVVKMEERRLSTAPSVQPFCRQYQVHSEGPATPLRDEHGNIIEVHIVENEPGFEESHNRKQRVVERGVIERLLGRGFDTRDMPEMSDCGCMWWAT